MVQRCRLQIIDILDSISDWKGRSVFTKTIGLRLQLYDSANLIAIIYFTDILSNNAPYIIFIQTIDINLSQLKIYYMKRLNF